MASQGFPGFELIAWNAILAPRGTPPTIVESLNQHIEATLKDPEIQAFMRSQYFTACAIIDYRLDHIYACREEALGWGDRCPESGSFE
jgi:hypothetical protein